MVKVLVAGCDDDQWLTAVVAGFRQLTGCQCDPFPHPWTPVWRTRDGGRLRRFWHRLNTTAVSRHLRELGKTGGYDLVVDLNPECLLPAFVQDLRASVHTACWYFAPTGAPGPEDGTLATFEHVFCATAPGATGAPRVVHLPPGYDPFTWQPLPRRHQQHDLVWVGGGTPEQLTLLDSVARIAAKRGWDFGAYGPFYSGREQRDQVQASYPALAQAIRRHRMPKPEEANRLFATARVALVVPPVTPPFRGLPSLALAVAGAGALLFCAEGSALDGLLTRDREFVTFRDAAECEEKLAYLLDHEPERTAIAAAAHDRAVREHTLRSRCQALLQAVFPPPPA